VVGFAVVNSDFLKERAIQGKMVERTTGRLSQAARTASTNRKALSGRTDEAERELHRIVQIIVAKWDSTKPSILDENPKP